MKHNILQKLAALLFLCCTTANLFAQTPEQWKTLKGDITLYMANDLGRNGYYEQKPIAELMGQMAETVGPKCVIAAGDIHQHPAPVAEQALGTDQAVRQHFGGRRLERVTVKSRQARHGRLQNDKRRL